MTSTNASQLIHATSIALSGVAVLIRGASGSGKSALALELMESSGTGLGDEPMRAELVADDQSLLFERNGELWVRAPESIRGLFEVRGLGIVSLLTLDAARVGLVVDLVEHSKVTRLPESCDLETTLMDRIIPRFAIDPHMPAAAARVRLAVRQLALRS